MPPQSANFSFVRKRKSVSGLYKTCLVICCKTLWTWSIENKQICINIRFPVALHIISTHNIIVALWEHRVRIESDVQVKTGKVMFYGISVTTSVRQSCMETIVVVALGLVDMKTFTSLWFKSSDLPWIAVQQESEFYKVCGTPQGFFFFFSAARMKLERLQNSTSNKSRRDREKRHLCGPVAPGLQHVVWRLSNSNRSNIDYLESFERQPGQLWGCALTH